MAHISSFTTACWSGTGTSVAPTQNGKKTRQASLGGFAALLSIQVASAAAAIVGTLRGHWKRHLLVEMADSAGGIWYEGGVFVALPGLVIGAITGVILALTGAGGR